MPTLNYAAPSTVDEAVKLLAGSSGLAKVLSGGTDLLVQLRSGRLKPDLIVDTKKIPGIIGIREEGGGFVIGAATPGAMVEAHAGLNKAWPGVVEALDLIGSTQIQGRASLAGNLCNASPAADSVPALYRGRRDSRRGRPQGTPRGAGGADPHRPGPHARSPRANSSWSSSARRGRRARAMPICASFRAPRWTSRWSAAASASRSTTRASAPRRASRWARWRRRCCWSKDAADALVGHKLDDAALAKLAAAARAACKPIDDKRGTIEYRTKVAGVLARRVAAIAFDRAGQEQGKTH